MDRELGMQRRRFLRLNLVALVTGAFGTVFGSGAALAKTKPAPAGVPWLDVKDPQAAALKYAENIKDPEVAKIDVYRDAAEAGQFCNNCQLYSGNSDAAWGPCAVFSYRTHPESGMHLVVGGNGWCTAWGPRAG
jgi:hypothetical protein